jgi:hypothetical protein
MFHYSAGPLVWSCNKYKVASLSTTEGEYHGMFQEGTEELWIHQLLEDIGLHVQNLTTIYCDNQRAIQVVENIFSHSKMKYVDMHAHYLRQLVHDNVISLEYCIIEDQVAHIFTKPLVEEIFIKLCVILGIQKNAIKWGVLLMQFHLLNLERCVFIWGGGGVET